jgi:hypothetical protein
MFCDSDGNETLPNRVQIRAEFYTTFSETIAVSYLGLSQA